MLGVGLVHYAADDGTLRTIRQAFTSAAAVDPFARVAAGRSAFRVLDLLALGPCWTAWTGTVAPERGPTAGRRPVKEILPHV